MSEVKTTENIDGKNKMSRRKFIALTGGIGVLVAAGTYKFTEFSSNAKGKIVIVGGGAAGLSMAARLQRWLKYPDLTLIDPSDRQYYQPGFTFIASGVYKPNDVWKNQDYSMQQPADKQNVRRNTNANACCGKKSNTFMEGIEPAEKYNGYAACPIVTDYGHVLLCEFDYDKKEQISAPFKWFFDMSKEQHSAWMLKKYILKPMYFYGMTKGYM